MRNSHRVFKFLFDWLGIVFVCILAVLGITGVWGEKENAAQTSAARASKSIVVVDAGHGGADGGAASADNVQEAGLNLIVAKLVEKGLKDAGFEVVMTRESEDALAETKKEDMKKRRALMREEDVTAIVSVHMNKWRDAAVHGPMAFYMKGSQEGEKLATQVIESVCAAIGNPARPANPGDYYVLRESVAPAVIIECGFLSNRDDAKKLQDPAHQKQLAQGIVEGVSAYFQSCANTPAPIETQMPNYRRVPD